MSPLSVPNSSSTLSRELDSMLDSSQNSEVNAKISILLSYLSIVCQFVVITVALPAMVADPNIDFTAVQAGGLMTVGTIAATLGKLGMTYFSSNYSAKVILISVLVGTSVANVCMSLGSSYGVLVAVWAVSRFFHAGGWVSSAQLTCSLVPKANHGSALGTLAFASRVGATMSTSVLGGLLILGCSWRSLFIVTSAIALLMVVSVKHFVPDESKLLLNRMLKKVQKRQNGSGDDEFDRRTPTFTRKQSDQHYRNIGIRRIKFSQGRNKQAVVAYYDPIDRSKYKVSINDQKKEGLSSLLKIPEVWLMIATRCMLQLIMEFQGFISLMSVDWLNLSPGQASQVAAGFSMGAACSVLLGGMFYTRLSSKFKRLFISGLLACALICIIGLGASNGRTFIAVPSIVMLGSMFAVPFYIPMSSFNMKKGGKNAGALEAFSETFAYGVAFAFSAVLSRMIGVGGWGWTGVLKMLSISTFVGLVLMSLLMKYVIKEEEGNYQDI